MEKNHWTPAEKALLRKHFQTMTARQIGEMMGRSGNAVMCKAHFMGLKKRRFNPVPEIKSATKAAVDPRPARQRPRITVVKHPAGRIITHRMAG